MRINCVTKFALPALCATTTTTTMTTTRAFSFSVRAMAEGDTGAPPKTGGSGDAFQKREKAQEDYAIRQRERAKLLELKQRLNEQQAHLKKLSDHIDEVTKDQDGEQK